MHMKEQTYGESHTVECIHGGDIHAVGPLRGHTHGGGILMME